MPFAYKSLAAAGGLAICVLAAGAMATSKSSLTRTIVVNAPVDAVWQAVGPFCAIGDWHPAIGSCALDGAAKPTRTLVTRDGAATFIELQEARNDAAHRYSYSFTSSPVPVTHYRSTFSVKANGKGSSVVTWRGEYLPNPGQEAAAQATLTGIYESGLAAIANRFNHPPQAER